jgi:hypothetical protein
LAGDTQPSLIVLVAAPLVPRLAEIEKPFSEIRASWIGGTNILRSAAHDHHVM